MLRRRQGQLEPPAVGEVTQGYGNTSAWPLNHSTRHDPPDHRQSDPSVIEESHHDSIRKIDRDPNVENHATRPKQNKNSSWSAAAMRSAMRLSQESYRSGHDPSVVNEPVIAINRSANRDPPQDTEESKIQLSYRHKEVLKPRQDNNRRDNSQNGSDVSVAFTRSLSLSSAAGSSSSGGSPNSQQRAFLRNFLKKQGDKSSAPGKNMATAKQKLLRNVLKKSQGGVIKTTASADATRIFQADSISPNNGSLREKWKRVAAANASRMGKRIINDISKDDEVEELKQQVPNTTLKIDSDVSSESRLKTLEESHETNTPGKKEKGFNIRQRYEETLRVKIFEKTIEDESKDVDSEMDEEYMSFLDILHEEVSGQHVQLWENFRSAIMNKSRVTVNPKSPSKAFKFDPETKQALLKMNLYLKNVSTVEHIGVTQLVKDKKFQKEKSRLSMLVDNNADNSRRSSLPPILADRIEKRREEMPQVQIQEPTQRDRGERKGKAVASGSDQVLRQLNMSSQGNHVIAKSRYAVGDFSDERSYTTTSEVSKIQTAPSEDSSVCLNRYDVPLKSKPYDHITAQRSNDDEIQSGIDGRISDTILSKRSQSTESSEDSSQRSSPDVKSKHPLPIIHYEQKESTKKHKMTTPGSDSGFEITLGQFESKMHPSGPDSVCSHSTSGSVAPWKDVQLRSISSDSPGSQSATMKSSPEFAQLQLRRLDSPIVSPSSAANESHRRYSIDSKRFHSNEAQSFISPSYKPPKSEIVSQNERTPPVQNSKPMVHSYPNKFDSESNVSVDNTIISTTADACINLRPDGSNIAKVYVSKEQIRKTIQASKGSPLQLEWVLDRSLIKSLSLDMADNQANLVLKEGRRAEKLAFITAEDCLRFANSFYEFSESSMLRSTNSEIPNSVNQQDQEEDEISLLDTLNDEEQKVLETYRRLRKIKAADDAMQESISQGTMRTDDQMSLTSAQVEKYRGMLRMSFPLAVVKNKMTRDGVSSRILAAIEATANDSPPIFVSAQKLPGSPVSTFSSSCGLSVIDIGTAESYRQLIDKLGNAESVRKQMEDNEVDPKIVAHVFGENESKAESTLTSAEATLVEGYLKMLKLAVPEEAVRHKMLKDDASDVVINSVFGGETKRSSSSAGPLSAEEISTADKFKKMLSMGVPKDGVKHKMIREQVCQKVMDVVLEASSANTTNESNISAPPISTEKDLTNDEKSLITQYKRMLKLQIPREQVLSRMQKDGVGEKVITAVIGKRLGSSMSSSTANSKSSEGTSSNLVSLHWTPLSGTDLDDSIWSRTSKKRGVSTKSAGSRKPEFNELMELFQKKATTGKIRSKKNQDTTNGSDKAKLLDITRSNNVAISLKAFKEFPIEELAEIILYLDPLRKIRGEKCQFIRDILPTSTETRVIREYEGSDERLEPAEVWFRQVVDIPRIEAKAQILRTMEMFSSEATLLMDSFSILNEVCYQVTRSEKLQDLLEMVLNIGNIMNEGTRTGGASGFKFDSLLKLTQTKSSDGKTTVLDFLVNMFASKSQREVLDLTSDFPRCRMASRMMITDLLKEVKNLGDSLEQCKDELEQLIKEDEKDSNEPENDVLDLTAINSSDLDDPRNALLSALKARGSSELQNSRKFIQRDLFLSVVEEKKPKEAVKYKEVLDESMMNREAGINRLRRFIAEETETYACLIQKRDQALEACRDTSKYCGESGGHSSTAPLLGVLAQFADNLDDAVRKYDQRAVRELRSRKQGNDQSCSSSVQTCATGQPVLAQFADNLDDAVRKNDQKVISELRSKKQNNDQSCASSVQTCATGQTEAKDAKQSLILMVNEMLKDANERTKEDFTKGRVYGNPSKSLQAIYERETAEASVDNNIPEDDRNSGPVKDYKVVERKPGNDTVSTSETPEISSSSQPVEPLIKDKTGAQSNHLGQQTNCSSSNDAGFQKTKGSSSKQQLGFNDGNANHSGDKEATLPKSFKRDSSIADAVKIFSCDGEKRPDKKCDETCEIDQTSARRDDTSSSKPGSLADTVPPKHQNKGFDNPTEESCSETLPNDSVIHPLATEDNEASVTRATERKAAQNGDTILVDSGIDLSSSRNRLSSNNLQQPSGKESLQTSVLPEQKENTILRDLARRLSSRKEKNAKPPDTQVNPGDQQHSEGILKTLAALPVGSPSPTLVSDKGESTVTRLARRKREEKSKTRKSLSEDTTTALVPPTSEEKQEPVPQESVMVQLARQMRKDRQLSANNNEN